MSTYTQILYQIVFSTKYRAPTLSSAHRAELFGYIAGVLANQKCHVFQVGGVADHLHIVTHIHPSVSLSEIVKDIKLSSTQLIKNKELFPSFNGWQDGYGAFTYPAQAKLNLINYVKNQEEHHRKKASLEEYIELLQEHQVDYDPKFLI